MALTNDEITYLQRQARVAFDQQPNDYQEAIYIINNGNDLTTVVNQLNGRLPVGQSIIAIGSALGQTQTDVQIIKQLVQLGFANDLIQAISHNKEQDRIIETLRNEMFESLNNFKQNTELQISNLIENNLKLTNQVIEYKTELDDTRGRLHKISAEFDEFRSSDSGEFKSEIIGKTISFESHQDDLENIIR